jgi:hypothetical protein
MINFNKKDPVADAIRDIMEKELVGNQKKLDKNHNGKLDKQDFEILRGQKVKEATDPNDRTEDTLVGRVKTNKKDDVGPGADFKSSKVKLKAEEAELEENAFDYKSPRQPEPNGGSGVKKGSRYGGSKQKEKPEQEEPKEKNEEYVDEKFGGTQNMLNQTTHKSNDPMRRLKVTTDHPRFANKPLNSTSQNILKNRLKSAQGTHSKPNLPEEAFTLKKMKEKYEEPILDELINEVLSKDADAGDWIHDFVHSDNPKFEGKSKAERKKMALGAYYKKQNEEAVQEGLKSVAKKAFKALTGGSDEDQRKDLQRKMGVPQTGQKPVKEEEQVDEVVHVYRQDADRDRGPLHSKHSAPYREVNQKARDKLAGEVKSARKSGAFKVTTHASATGHSGKTFTQKTAGGSEGSKLHVMGLKNMKANESVVMEGRSPVSSQGMDTPFVTDGENKPLANAKELAAKTMKRMKNEMLGKTGTSE